MINAVYVLKGKNSSSKDYADLLRIIAGRTSYQVGCIESKIWHDKETSEIMIKESWQSMEDIMIHISSKLFNRMLSAMEMSSIEPMISYFDCGKVRGIDLIEEVRLRGKNIEVK